MPERFEIDQDGLIEFLRGMEVVDTPPLTLADVIVAWSGDHFRDAPTEVLLAQLAYLIGISTDLFPRPDDFIPHSLLGIAGSYHGEEQRFFLVLSSNGGPSVSDEDLALVEFANEPELLGLQMIEVICQMLIDNANTLIEPARAASAARGDDLA